MQSHDKINLFKSLVGEMYDFRSESLNSSKSLKTRWKENDGKTQQNVNKNGVEPAFSDTQCSIIEIVPENTIGPWFSLDDAQTLYHMDIKKKRLDSSVPSRPMSAHYQLLKTFGQAIAQCGPFYRCLHWYLSNHSEEQSKERIRSSDFIDHLVSRVSDKIHDSLGSHGCQHWIDALLDDLDTVSTRKILKLHEDTPLKLDQESLSTTISNRLFGYRKKILQHTTHGILENSCMMRCFTYSPKKASFVDCIRATFHRKGASHAAEEIQSMPRILMLCADTDPMKMAKNKCTGFPLHLRFFLQQVSPKGKDFEEDSDHSASIFLPFASSRKDQEQFWQRNYAIQSIGFQSDANTPNRSEGPIFNSAWRSHSENSGEAYGLWCATQVSHGSLSSRQHLISLGDLQQKSILWACYVLDTPMTSASKVEQVTEKGYLDAPKQVEVDNHISGNESEPDARTDSEDSHLQSCAEESQCLENTPIINNVQKPLMDKEEKDPARNFIPEQSLGLPMHDSEWNEALDCGKKKKVRAKQSIDYSVNPFQNFVEKAKNYENMAKKIKKRKHKNQ